MANYGGVRVQLESQTSPWHLHVTGSNHASEMCDLSLANWVMGARAGASKDQKGIGAGDLAGQGLLL